MNLRRSVQLAAAALMLVASLIPFQAALGWGGCGDQVVVQAGDTLSGIAEKCGTSAWAILEANPGIGWNVYAGQVLNMPSGHSPWHDPYPTPAIGGSYTVKWGDTLGKIAARYNVSLRDLLAVNRQHLEPGPDLPVAGDQPARVCLAAAGVPANPTHAIPRRLRPCYYGCYPAPGAHAHSDAAAVRAAHRLLAVQAHDRDLQVRAAGALRAGPRLQGDRVAAGVRGEGHGLVVSQRFRHHGCIRLRLGGGLPALPGGWTLHGLDHGERRPRATTSRTLRSTLRRFSLAEQRRGPAKPEPN